MQRLDVTDVVEREHQIHEYLKHPCIARCVADQLVGREPHVAADSIRPDALPVADWETFEHYEPGNPASNPRRKPFTSK